MAAEPICAECGAPLLKNAPGNRCPKCLLQLGLEANQASPGNPSEPRGEGPDESPARPSESDSVEEGIGTMIGRYRLLQQIGEGGFGVVFMAEQTEPVQRKVALKVIKAGMDTREIIARFEAERQALALMDHPNIARVLDGGSTASRRPYFVMELVRGVPLTQYCDEAELSTRDRLELFIKVCRAVQHAHQKGVIHRDLKPTNVLVTLHDGEPVPKVIDFGVAKALGQKLTEKTLFTRFEQMIGTPAYMSPEQAALGGLDIDTRSDVFSLGVLLYELLTGVTPLDAETLRKGALDEVRRMIRETDPPKPSTRLQTMGGRLTAVARCRHVEPAALSRQVRGDLDWITMKCLEKDRQRRYETINGLARDIERHLNNEPVMARPPSRLYEFQKTVRRHKFGFAAAGAVILALSFGVVVSTWEAIRARRAEHEAQTEATKSQEMARFLEKIFVSDLSGVLARQGKFEEAEALRQETLSNLRKASGDQRLEIAKGLFQLGSLWREQGRKAEGEKLVTEQLPILRELGSQDPELLPWIGASLEKIGDFALAEQWYRHVLLDGSNSLRLTPHTYARTVKLLAGVLLHETKFDEIEASQGEWLQNVRARLPADDLELADLLVHIMYVPLADGRFAEAEKLGRECLAIYEKKLPDDWRTYKTRCMLGSCLLGEKQYTEAEALLLSACKGLRQHQAEIPAGWLPSVREDLQRPVVLYEAAGRPEQAAEWRKKLEQFDYALTNAALSAKPSP